MSEANLLVQRLCQLWPWYCGECEKPGPGPRRGKHCSGQGYERVSVFKTQTVCRFAGVYM